MLPSSRPARLRAARLVRNTALPLILFALGCDSQGVIGAKDAVITLLDEEIELEVGESAGVVATVDAPAGVSRALEYSSSNEAVATVSDDGRITAVAVGTAFIDVILVDDDDVKQTVEVTVVAPRLRAAITPQAGPVIRPGEMTSFACRAFNVNNDAEVAATFTWSSSNTGVATVSATGQVTGVADGSAQITCTRTGGSESATAPITVQTPPLTLTLTPAPATVQMGATVTMQLAMRDHNNNVVTGRNVTWSSDNSAVATVSAAGVVTAVAPGTTNVRATVDGPGGGSISAAVTVPAPVLAVAVTPTSLALQPELSAPATCVVRNTANNAVLNVPVTWSSSNTAVATVSPTGTVTAVADGSATITCSAGANASATVQVTVTSVPLTIAVVPATATMQVGASQTLAVTVTTANGVPVTGRTITVTVDNTGVATAEGLQLTGVAIGSTVARVTVAGPGGGTVTVPVQVTQPEYIVQLAPSSLQLELEQSAPLTCTVRNRNNNAVVALPVVFNSANGGIATVSASGVVTARGVGTTSVGCTLSGGGATASTSVTVISPPLTITATPNPMNLLTGATRQLVVALALPNGTPVTGRTVTFASSNTAIATVNSSGIVTGVAAGAANITVNVPGSGGGSITVPVTVTAPVCGASGAQSTVIDVLVDVGGHNPFIGMPLTMVITLTITGNSVTITGTGAFVPVSGTINSSCQINATGTGTVAGFPNVGVRLTGEFVLNALFEFIYSMGTAGELPGGTIIDYRIRKQ